MASHIPLRCHCGTVRGEALEVSPRRATRIVCYCADCQAFGRFLGGEGLVDAQGGTDIFQTTPAQIRIHQGREQLTCMRLSDQGMIRWYTRCCRTAVGNTMTLPGLPFVGVPVGFFEISDEATRNALLGAPVRVMARSARGSVEGGNATLPASLLLRSVALLALHKLAGRHKPSIYFDVVAKRPSVAPQVLSAAERAALG